MKVFHLSECDVRSMVRLLGEVCALPGGHAEKKRHLMDGLCRLVDVDAWVWVLCARMEPDKLPVYVGYQQGGFTDDQFALFLRIQSHPDMAVLTAPYASELQLKRRHLTRPVQQIGTQEAFLSSDVVRLWDLLGIHFRLISTRPLPDGALSGIGLYRKAGRPFLDERQTRVAHIILSEVPWLHEQGWPEDRGASVVPLSPRLWLVHEMLLQGFRRSQIAHHLRISENTVGGYMKDVYRHFAVQSQAQLLSRFFQGDGGDLG